MLKDLNPTTRKFPNTLADAFPDSVERAQWFFPPERKTNVQSIIFYTMAVCLWVSLAYLLAKN